MHQRVVAAGDLDVLQAETPPEPLVVEADAAAVDAEVAHRAAHLVAEVETVGGARPLHPLDPRREMWNVGIDIVRTRRTIHRRHHRPAGPDVLDPGGLVERRGQVVVGEHQDGMLGLAPGQDHDVGPRLVALVGDAVEAREIEDVERHRDNQAVELPRLHVGQQPIQVAETFGQPLPAELGAALRARCRRHRFVLRVKSMDEKKDGPSSIAGEPGRQRPRRGARSVRPR